ncbi:MAG: phosphatase PAP2 family protein [Labilithrix sp.]|nr:phosphatase PAP2 family protein [Labilithrix sp.]MCW5810935.1 phosphatase PAP2 family protein [Labilithrix sp.]
MAELDVRVFLYLHHALASWLGVAAVLSAIGGGWGGLVVVPLWASPRSRAVARSLTYVLCVNAAVVYGLKHVVARARPCNCLPEVRGLVFGSPTDYSFPSGHSAGSFSFCVFFAVVLLASSIGTRPLRVAGATALVLVATGVALSRIALGVHFPGDILAGGILGATIGGVGAHLHLRLQQKSRDVAELRG